MPRPAPSCAHQLRNSGLALASKGRAFRSLDGLIVRQGGEHVLYGGTLALAAVIATWSKDTGTSVAQLLDDKIR